MTILTMGGQKKAELKEGICFIKKKVFSTKRKKLFLLRMRDTHHKKIMKDLVRCETHYKTLKI